jgi:hypothetical protein
MRIVGCAVVALSTLAFVGPASADSMWDVASARANARAGGPISGYDAELLERWGCLSGTNSAFCKRIRHGANCVSARASRRSRKYR